MHSKLQKKLIFYISMPTLLLTVILGIVSLSFVDNNLYRNYNNFANENVVQAVNISDYFLSSAKYVASQVSQNPDIIADIKSPIFNNRVTSFLNHLKNTSAGIAAVSVYTLSDNPDIPQYIYNTSEIALLPTLEELANNDQIKEFFNSNKTTLLSIRTSAISGIYNNNRYDEKYGMITNIIKLYDLYNSICGYLLVDINPSYLYDNFFSYEDYPDFHNVETYIISHDNIPLYTNTNPTSHYQYLNEALTNKVIKSNDKNYLIITRYINDNEYRIITLVPLERHYYNIRLMILLIAILIAIINLITFFIAKKVSHNITYPIAKLKAKMQKTNILMK